MPITVTRGAKASSVIVVPRNVRRDGVDEECHKQNIKVDRKQRERITCKSDQS